MIKILKVAMQGVVSITAKEYISQIKWRRRPVFFDEVFMENL